MPPVAPQGGSILNRAEAPDVDGAQQRACEKLVREDAQVSAGARQRGGWGDDCFHPRFAGEAADLLCKSFAPIYVLACDPVRADQAKARDPQKSKNRGGGQNDFVVSSTQV